MIKIIISSFISIALLINSCVILYWRDTAYDPAGADLLCYLLILPIAVTAAVLAPYLIYRYLKYRKENQAEKEIQAAAFEKQQAQQLIDSSKAPAMQSSEFSVHIYAAAAWHSFGENEAIIEQYKQFKSPELDASLLNAYGLPVLSLRIQDLDDLLQDAEDDETMHMPMREQRISHLINHQIERHAAVLADVAEHLKDSAMFYDSEIAYQYKMHPAWMGNIDADGEFEEEPADHAAKPLHRLNLLCIHLLLPEEMIHSWNHALSEQMEQTLAEQFSIVPAQIYIEQHFISQHSAYAEWLKILERISQQEHAFSLVISADSEIDQALLDEKFWQSEQYIAAEYVSSWCIANVQTEMKALLPCKTLKMTLNEASIQDYLQDHQLNHHVQFQQDKPCVLILDDASNVCAAKKLQQKFMDSAIEPYHFLYGQAYVGHTQKLSSIFSFMLGTFFPEDVHSLVYSAEQENIYALFQGWQEEAASQVLQK